MLGIDFASAATHGVLLLVAVLILLVLLIVELVEVGLIGSKEGMHPNSMRFAVYRDDGGAAATRADQVAKREYLEAPQFWGPTFDGDKPAAASQMAADRAAGKEGAVSAPLPPAGRSPVVNGQSLVPY